jgi:ADP-heptose:LPS heptosyltransferase
MVLFSSLKLGGILRLFSEILPRMCEAYDSLRINLLMQGWLRQSLTKHRHIKHRSVSAFERYLRPNRVWQPVLPKIKCFMCSLWTDTDKGNTKDNNIELSKIKSVLIIRLDAIGDVVMTTPFLRELKRNLPSPHITLLVSPDVYNLVELCPYVNEVRVYDGHLIRGRLKNARRCWNAFKFGYQQLRKRRFDLAVFPRWDADYYHGAVSAYFSRACWRVGYSKNSTPAKKIFNPHIDRLFTHVINDDTAKHEVEHNLDIIRYLGGVIQEKHLELWLSPNDEVFAEQLLDFHGVRRGDLLIALGPAARTGKRRWPLANFIELGRWLQRQYRARLMVVGGRGEENVGRELEQKVDSYVVNTVGKTTLRQACAILKRCNLFIGNDAGPMHLAAAANVPVVEISCHPKLGCPAHANSPIRFRPWGVHHTVLQPEKALKPCTQACTALHPHCISTVTVEQVKKASMAFLSATEKSAHIQTET